MRIGQTDCVLMTEDIRIHVRRKNIKNMYLRVKEDTGVVEVSAPLQMSDRKILCFVNERRDWIKEAQERIAEKKKKEEAAPVIVPFMEREMRRNLKKKLTAYIEGYEPVMGVKSNGFTIKKMKTRWGSCNVKTGHLNFNFALSQAPDECVEYVVVHELTHLLEPSHNARFWGLMEQYLPDARKLRKELNSILLK